MAKLGLAVIDESVNWTDLTDYPGSGIILRQVKFGLSAGQAACICPGVGLTSMMLARSDLLAYPAAEWITTDYGVVGTNGGTGTRVRWTPSASLGHWIPVGGRALVGSIATAVTAPAGTAENILFQLAIPAGIINNGDRIYIRNSLSKNGTAETMTINYRWGTAGTIADGLAFTHTNLAVAARTDGEDYVFKRVSATTVAKEGSSATTGNFSGTANAAFPATATVPDLGANKTFITITSTASVGTEQCTLRDIEVWHVADLT